MKSYSTLPEGYEQTLSIDLQKDKKLSLLVNGLSLLIAAAMIVPLAFVIPFSTLFEGELWQTVIRLGVLAVAIIAYIILHEAVHALAMKICGTKKVRFGFTGLYAFAGSDDYYPKASYIFIALAPVVLWGIVLTVLCVFLPISWFWVAYGVQIMNLSGATGDFYVSVRFASFPKKTLIRDSGVSMSVFKPSMENTIPAPKES